MGADGTEKEQSLTVEDTAMLEQLMSEILQKHPELAGAKSELEKKIIEQLNDPEREKKEREFKALVSKSKKQFKERFKDHEPYDLSEIADIIKQAKKQAAKENLKDKIAYYCITLEKVALTIANSESLFQKLQVEEIIDDPDGFCCELDHALNLKKQFEIEIAELQLEAAKQSRVDVVPEKSNVLPTVDGATELDKPTERLKTIEELAEYLQISKSTIYHWVSQDKIVARKIGNQLRFDMEDINDLTREGKLGKQENTKPNFCRTKKKIHHFTFPSSLEPFTNVFVQKGYLDKGYDALMNDRFSESPKLGEDAILWKRDAVSLITFIYLADRLGFIDKSSSADTREHNSSSEEEKEDGDEAKDNEAKEIKYQVLVMENFKIMDGALSKSKLSRAWKGVNNAINKLREQVADRENIKTEDVKKALTRKEAIESYNRPKYIRHRI